MAKIQICGLFRPEDIAAANRCRPDYIGFVFAPSRRQVTAAEARRLRGKLAPGIVPVGVFVDAPLPQVASLLKDGTIAMAQLHGGEDEAYIRQLRACTGRPVIRAVQVERAEDILAAQETEADYLLLDNGAGGTGECFCWGLIGRPLKPFFLAGGLSEENLDAALQQGAFALDVSSGAETGGLKDAEKMRRIVERVREEKN